MREGVRGGRGDHEDRAETTTATMNGGSGAASLGLRSGSSGSLQQLLLQQNGVAVSVQCAVPGGGRKQTKVMLPGSREKDKFLPWVCKIAGRKRVGMLFLAIVSIAVFASILSIFGKDESMSEGPEMNWQPLRPFIDIHKPGVSVFPLIPLKNGQGSNAAPTIDIPSASRERELQDHLPIINASIISSSKYCEHFSYSPPPADKKRTGPRPCEVCYIPVEHAVALMPTSPSVSPVLKDLSYLSEGSSHINISNGGSIFGGHPSLQQREASFDIKETMAVHCGFFKGNGPGGGSEFDIDGADLIEMEQCHGVVVASAIFGNYDIVQQPKNISEYAKKRVCFYMFLDEETETYMKNHTTFDANNRIGIWRIVIVRNLPYVDPRRNGKVPKLLLHRLFPNARYSLWIDGKLELVVDPYQILERFLWRKNATFAISRHYRRFDVFVEAEANKAAGKYDNASIDHQIDFYKNEGLAHYSEAKLPITSDVPEGCVIIREHIPITSLFTCLWFNEVDRFTSRDQISFSTVRDKIISKVNWTVNMFLDCERRNFVVQAYHRDLLEQRMQLIQSTSPPLLIVPMGRHRRKPSPETIPEGDEKSPSKKLPLRRDTGRNSASRHHRPKTSYKKRTQYNYFHA